jgi:hypothetical protein
MFLRFLLIMLVMVLTIHFLKSNNFRWNAEEEYEHDFCGNACDLCQNY